MGDSEAALKLPKENGSRQGDCRVSLRSALVILFIFKFESMNSAFTPSPLNSVSLWGDRKTYFMLKKHGFCKQAH